MAMERFGRLVMPVCDCCGNKGRAAQDEAQAARWAHLCRWDTPGRLDDGTPYEGYLICPACVKAEAWPPECEGWYQITPVVVADCPPLFHADDLHDGPTIRLADGDASVTLPLDEVPEALIVE